MRVPAGRDEDVEVAADFDGDPGPAPAVDAGRVAGGPERAGADVGGAETAEVEVVLGDADGATPEVPAEDPDAPAAGVPPPQVLAPAQGSGDDGGPGVVAR